MTIKVLNYAGPSGKAIREIEGELSRQYSLKDLIAWAQADPERFISGVVKDVVVQDEFTHDVIVPWGTELFLVYDTT